MNRRISNKEFRRSKEGNFAINLPPFIIRYSLFDIRYSFQTYMNRTNIPGPADNLPCSAKQ
jgi:hypothetical protein